VFYKSITTLTQTAGLGLCLSLGTVSPSAADGLSFGLTVGALTDDFLGRSEQYSTLGFNGISLTTAFEYKRFSASITAGSALYGTNDILANYDVSLQLGSGQGDWEIGVGKIDRHWSPSQYTSVILSKNAPGFDSAYLRKSNPTQTNLPVLRWLGPWDGEFFVGTTSDAGQPDNALMMGMRLRIRPIQNLEVDFVRTAQFGGAGNSQSLGTFVDVLLGDTNEGSSSEANQMAGVGISYTLPNIANGMRIYTQAVGEDEAGGVPSCFMYLGGMEMDVSLFGVPSQVTLEHVDTRIAESTNGFCGPNTAYNNNTFSYAQDSVALGAAIDSEGASTSLRVKHDLETMAFDWSIGHYQINDASAPNHRLSSTRVQGIVVTAGFSREMFGGTVSAIVAHQGFDLDTAGFSEGMQVGLGFSKSF
jgi:hypothetical protein